MDFQATQENMLIRSIVREFMEREVVTHVQQWDAESYFPEPIIRKLGEMGYLGMTVPERWGGAGLTNIDQITVIEELARVSPSIAITVSVTGGIVCHLLNTFGTNEQKEKYLVPLARGEAIGSLAHTEPEAGSDAGAIRSRAVLIKGDRYLLSGNKVWVTNAEHAQVLIVQAVTNPELGKRGINSFIVETQWEGVMIGKNEKKLGLHSSVTNSVTFDNVEIPVANRLGENGAGFKIVMSGLDSGRIGVAAQAVGIAVGAFEHARAYAVQRHTFGRPIAEHQAISFMLADMAMHIDTARLLTQRAAWLKDQGRPYTTEASMAKLFSTEMCQKITYDALQIFGSYGYSQEYPVERFFRDARATTIYEGTSEIQRIVIGRDIIRRWREYA